jgi:DNA-binding transcriptional ArsR family regulator/uncharacterized protein YndB with AHSA1/START domain
MSDVPFDPVWKAVADPTRRRLIELLRDGPRTTGDLCQAFPTSRFAVMKHLGVLERCGVVTVRRAGRERWNSLNPDPLRALEGRWPAGMEAREPDAHDARPEGQPGATVSIDVFIDTATWRVFDALTVNVAAWWGPPHLYAADASNLVLEPHPGGRFFEEWGHHQGLLRGTVTAIRQDARLELAGSIFDETPSTLRFGLERREGGTLLTVVLSAPAGIPGHAELHRRALDDLIREKLKAYLEHGTRSGVAS